LQLRTGQQHHWHLFQAVFGHLSKSLLLQLLQNHKDADQQMTSQNKNFQCLERSDASSFNDLPLRPNQFGIRQQTDLNQHHVPDLKVFEVTVNIHLVYKGISSFHEGHYC
jgi:hypothetical protein